VVCLKETERTADPAEAGFIPAEDGAMWLDEGYRPALRDRGLTQFDRVMSVFDGRCEKTLPDREVWHFRCENAAASPRGIYVKRHHLRTWGSRLRALVGLPPAPTPGRIEAANVSRLSSQGIEVMRLIAYGEKVHADGLQESFVITEELEAFSELHHYLRREYSSPPTERSERKLLQLIRDVAGITRRFHGAGYNHRDLYCCHFFVKEQSSGRCEIRLIDLQRVQRRRWFRRRWIVKDLAQLSWSAPSACITCRHKIAFLHEYFGVKKLLPAHKKLILAVIRKQKIMEWKLGNDN
jgi:heptose I phosphotransferase